MVIYTEISRFDNIVVEGKVNKLIVKVFYSSLMVKRPYKIDVDSCIQVWW